MNKSTLIGRLTRDPEIRYTQTGKAVATFTLAVDRKRKTHGEKQADFIPIVAWGTFAETCAKYLFKGHRVYVEGRLQIRSYETNDKQKKLVAEVVMDDMEFLENKSASTKKQNSGERTNMSEFGPDVFPDEEIPF